MIFYLWYIRWICKELYDFLNERACRLGCSEKEAIQSVLFGQSTYLEKKDQIQDKEIRKSNNRYL